MAEAKRPVTPWSKGVPAAQQDRALKLFQEGNVLLEQYKYTEAAAVYEEALAAWDHPNIRFNIAICMINMRQPLVAWNHLKQAIRFGDGPPLGKRLYTEAMTSLAALESTLAELTVKSGDPGVTVMVDGAPILTAPGTHTMKLLAGKHQLVATRPGYITDSRALDLAAGKPVTEQIALAPEKVKLQVEVQRENYERRWPWWTPWAVTGSSVAVGLLGTAVYVGARSQIKQYDRDLAVLCPFGCTEDQIPAELKAQARSARRNSGVGIGLWCGAGALAITGGVMAILNRPRKTEERKLVPAVAVSRDYIGVGISLAVD